MKRWMSLFQGRWSEAVIFHCCGLWYNNTCYFCAVMNSEHWNTQLILFIKICSFYHHFVSCFFSSLAFSINLLADRRLSWHLNYNVSYETSLIVTTFHLNQVLLRKWSLKRNNRWVHLEHITTTKLLTKSYLTFKVLRLMCI